MWVGSDLRIHRWPKPCGTITTCPVHYIFSEDYLIKPIFLAHLSRRILVQDLIMGDRDSFNCLISGASRGIGRALAAHYLILDNTVVVATVRDPESTAARSLISMPAEKNSRIVVIAGYNKSEEITRDGISLLNKQEMIHHLDLVIANAGVPQSKLASLLGAELSELADLVLTNGLGPLMLFRETLPSMRKSKALHGARFVNIGSVTGSSASTSATNSMKMAPMGVSKACKLYLLLFSLYLGFSSRNSSVDCLAAGYFFSKFFKMPYWARAFSQKKRRTSYRSQFVQGETYQQALNIGRVDAVQKTCCPSDLSILSGVATDAFNQLNQSDSIPAEILSPEEAARIIAIVVWNYSLCFPEDGMDLLHSRLLPLSFLVISLLKQKSCSFIPFLKCQIIFSCGCVTHGFTYPLSLQVGKSRFSSHQGGFFQASDNIIEIPYWAADSIYLGRS